MTTDERHAAFLAGFEAGCNAAANCCGCSGGSDEDAEQAYAEYAEWTDLTDEQRAERTAAADRELAEMREKLAAEVSRRQEAARRRTESARTTIREVLERKHS